MASGMRQLAGTMQFLNSPVIWLNLNRTGVLKSCRCIAAPLPLFRWLTHCSAGSRIVPLAHAFSSRYNIDRFRITSSQ